MKHSSTHILGYHTKSKESNHSLVADSIIKSIKKDTLFLFAFLRTLILFVGITVVAIIIYLANFFTDVVKPAIIEAGLMTISKKKEFFVQTQFFFVFLIILLGFIIYFTII